ncbi:S1 family peptidase [Aliiroseovarius sp. S1123]|jgi:V8-like Glu-specific endopeptidase|uniref:trypsin-like serine peptidase n=1 Tax=unclassified Aliiroseovarius TaxID=2623558 RepID=UPI001FF635F9|nr:S1 family peptidase [Aliiroseovarius sp. S1123]MCK0171827.1 S1 family peptidase [Aliiroseovarius sp. S1123]
MKYLVAFLMAAFLLAGPLGASDPSPLRTLMTGDDSKGWEGVGRLNIGGGSFCTGSLIDENLVLTAAHCLFDRDSGERFKLSEIEFLAGWRGGRASAYRGVRRAVVHPGFEFTPEKGPTRVANDLALLELDTPIRNMSVKPFKTFSRPRKGAEVGVVSYAHDRLESPSLQETCKVLARQGGALVLSCTVDYGSSGAPVFVIEGGEPRIVSVISAKAMVRDIPVSLGTDLETPLAEMYEMLATDNGVFKRVETVKAPTVRQVGTGAAGPGGAKFVRP